MQAPIELWEKCGVKLHQELHYWNGTQKFDQLAAHAAQKETKTLECVSHSLQLLHCVINSLITYAGLRKHFSRKLFNMACSWAPSTVATNSYYARYEGLT